MIRRCVLLDQSHFVPLEIAIAHSHDSVSLCLRRLHNRRTTPTGMWLKKILCETRLACRYICHRINELCVCEEAPLWQPQGSVHLAIFLTSTVLIFVSFLLIFVPLRKQKAWLRIFAQVRGGWRSLILWENGVYLNFFFPGPIWQVLSFVALVDSRPSKQGC